LNKVSNEDKQNLNSLKFLYKLNTEGQIPTLFHEVKKAKQQAYNISNAIKERLLEIKKQFEEEQKRLVKTEASIDVVEHESKVERKIKKAEEDEKSFAELFASSISSDSELDKEKENYNNLSNKSDDALSKENSNEDKTSQSKENVNEQKSNSVEKQSVQPSKIQVVPQNNYKTQNNFAQGQNQNQFKNNTRQPYQNGNTQNRNNFYQKQQYNPNYQSSRENNSQFQNNNFQRKQYIPNQNFNNRFNNNQNRFQQRPNGNQGFQQNGQFSSQQRFQKPFVNRNNNNFSGSQNNQNRTLMGILPKKTSTLTSAASVFATKERAFGNKKKTTERPDDERKVNKKSLLRRGLIEEQEIEDRMVMRKLKLKRPKTETAPIVSAPITNAVITSSNITVKNLSEKIGKPVTEIIKQLMVLGIMTTINSSIDFATAELVSSELGVTLEQKLEKSFEEKLKENAKIDDGTNNDKRAPIVTIVGHVDHGKTSLLDYIRKTHVTSKEAGGITQTIGAYSINWNNEDITFIDTPGHEAFINMRKRGTEITDVAVLIIAGDDGIKPQTVEAIKHIKEAKVPMIVAITKIDKQNINIDRIKQQLMEYDILPEEWGGDTIVVPVSSVTGEGIDKLLEMILLVAEMQDLKCNKKRDAVGTIIEAQLDKNKGPVANIIVQNGTLKLGDCVVSGFTVGKIRAMINDKGKSVIKAGPSTPVSILGLDSVPKAGDTIQVVDEKFSKQVVEERKIKMAQEMIENGTPKSLDEFLATPIAEEKKALNIIIKASSQGSVEALKQSLSTIQNEEVKVEIVSTGVGNINENDIQLAKVSNAKVIAFDTKVLAKISNFAKQNKVEIREYDIIYKAIEDIEKLIKEMMAPKFEEKVVGHAEVRALFKISSVGTIAGCYVLDGKVVRNAEVKVLRHEQVVFEGKIATLKREKDDAKEVASGFECGIKIENYNDIEEGDILECIVKEQIKV